MKNFTIGFLVGVIVGILIGVDETALPTKIEITYEDGAWKTRAAS